MKYALIKDGIVANLIELEDQSNLPPIPDMPQPPAEVDALQDDATDDQITAHNEALSAYQSAILQYQGVTLPAYNDAYAAAMKPRYTPPDGFTLLQVDDTVKIGDSYDGSTFTSPEQPAPDYSALAQAALDATDMVAMRCFKAGVPFPPEWTAYVSALRGVLKNGTGPLPEQPAYPEGT